MAIERTFSILKPDATARNLTGAINAMIEQAGLQMCIRDRFGRQRAAIAWHDHAAGLRSLDPAGARF